MRRKYIAYIIAVLMLFSTGCGSDAENREILSHEKEEILPDQEAQPFEIVLTRRGIKNAHVNSGYMSYYSAEEKYILSDSVTADFFDENENHISRLTSLEATIDDAQRIYVAEKNVVVVSDTGVTLLTEKLFWNIETEKIFTDDFVTIITESDTVYGKGFESDRSLKNYEIKKATGVTYRKIDKQK